jgi:hypothetical protein
MIQSHAINVIIVIIHKNDDFFMPPATFLSSTASHLQILIVKTKQIL